MLVVVTTSRSSCRSIRTATWHGDGGYGRYFAYMSLFTTSMLGLVLFDSILLLLRLLGAGRRLSYLLIGFWFHRPAAAAAAKKAFLVTRFGDLGFLAADPADLDARPARSTSRRFRKLAVAGALERDQCSPGSPSASSPVRRASRRSSRCTSGCRTRWRARRPSPPWSTPPRWSRPASTWSRASSRSSASRTTQCWSSALVGGITALMAALLALVHDRHQARARLLDDLAARLHDAGARRRRVYGRDLPPVHARVLQGAALPRLRLASTTRPTPSTCARWAACASTMPITFATFLIGTLSLAGFFPLAGFWSKDEILERRLTTSAPWLSSCALVTAGLTAFYMFRAIFMTFVGEYHGGEPCADAHGGSTMTTTHGATHRTSRRSAWRSRCSSSRSPRSSRASLTINHDVEHLLARCPARRRRSGRARVPHEHRHRRDDHRRCSASCWPGRSTRRS